MYKLLVVEDEYQIRNGLCNYFPWNEIGFEVAGQMENGRQALEFIQSNHVDAMLCDIIMPVMTGLDLVKELNAQKSKIKIVFLSGYKDFEYAQKAIIYGVKNYIIKPTKYSEIFEAFSKIKEELDSMSNPGPVNETELSRQENEKRLSFNEKVIATIKEYVNEHYKSVTPEDAANLVHLSPFYLSKFFKEKTGHNFTDFVISVKMEKATELLKDINYKTYEVSSMVGYRNSKNFTRSFKKYSGKTPKEFRDSKSI